MTLNLKVMGSIPGQGTFFDKVRTNILSQIPEIHSTKNQSPEFIKKMNLLVHIHPREQEISWIRL